MDSLHGSINGETPLIALTKSNGVAMNSSQVEHALMFKLSERDSVDEITRKSVKLPDNFME